MTFGDDDVACVATNVDDVSQVVVGVVVRLTILIFVPFGHTVSTYGVLLVSDPSALIIVVVVHLNGDSDARGWCEGRSGC